MMAATGSAQPRSPRAPRWTLRVLTVACVLLASVTTAAAAFTATAPLNELSTRVGQQRVLSIANFNAFVLSGSGDLSKLFTFTATTAEAGRDPGTLQLSTNAGLTGYDGAAAASISFTADSADSVNTALDGVVFTPPAASAAGLVALTLSHDGSVLVTANCLVHEQLDLSAMRTALMDGVTSIDSGGSPGFVAAFGDDSGSVIDFIDGGATVAAASFGRGRVVLMGDHQMLSASTSASWASAGFIANALAWGARVSGAAVSTLRIVSMETDVTTFLGNAGYTNVVQVAAGSLTTAALAEADVVMGWLQNEAADITPLRAFAARGGFVFAEDYGIGYEWWWGGIAGARINALLRPAGLALSPKWPSSLSGVITIGTHIKVATGVTVSETVIVANLQPSASITEAEAVATGEAVTYIMAVVPSDAPLVLRLNGAIDTRVSTINPTPASPVSDPIDMAFIEIEGARLANTPVADVVKHRTADAVYGALSFGDPIVRTISVDIRYARWVSTGLYVPAGELVTVTVAAGETDKGYTIQVSGHKDSICGKRDEYMRICTSPARTFALDSPTVELRTAFGGALYIDVGDDPPASAFDVTVAGAVAAPFFVLGETTNAEWQTQLQNPAPYAELFSEHVAFSVRKSTVAATTDMDAVMRYWDEVVQHQDELGGYGSIRTYPYRINEDVQISIGYLHSGYPTQGPFGTVDDAMTLSTILAEGSWGWYHELGHESQLRPDGAWSHAMPFGFHGATEVTVNLFSAYAYDMMGVPYRGGWDWTARNRDALEVAISAGGDYVAGGAGEKLSLYLLVRFAFGWDATYKPLIREYSALKDGGGTVPSADQDKVDDFLRRMSRLTGVSLRQYLVEGWGLTVTDSEATTAALAGLPSWMPIDAACIDDIGIPTGGSKQLDLGAGHLSLCAVTTTIATQPTHGSLHSDGGGKWTYRAGASTGATTFSYKVETCAGNSATCTVAVTVADQVEVKFPSVAVGNAGTPLEFRRATFNGISVTGFTAASASSQHTYTVAVLPSGSGTVSLGVVTDLTFTTGDGSAAETMTFSATPSAANAALASLAVTAPAGRPRLEIKVTGTGVAQIGKQQLAIAFNAAINTAETVSFLSDSVATIDSGDAPGGMIAYGSSAIGAIDYASNDGSPFVAAAMWGSGRVVAVPDHQALLAPALSGASATLARNAVAWAAGAATPDASGGSSWKVVALDADIVTWAATLYDASSVTKGSLRAGLDGADVFIASWLDTELTDDDAEAIADFVAAGGGLLIADYGKGWTWWWGGLDKCLGNRVLREAGIGFTDQWPKDFSGNTPPHVMHMGADVKAATAQYMSIDEAVAILSDRASHSATQITTAEAARDAILPLVQGADPRRRTLASLTCTAGQVFDPEANSCGAACPTAAYPDGATCEPCDASCASCSGGGTTDCTACDTTSANPVLDGSTCVPCTGGTFSNNDGTCAACHDTCGSCFGAADTECTACANGYGWNDAHTKCALECTESVAPISNLFVWNVDGVRKLVTDDCGASSPYATKCNDPATETVTASGVVYYVLDTWSEDKNLVAVCPAAP